MQMPSSCLLYTSSADDELKGKYHEVLNQLPAMKELYGHRARLRKERGCMDIESGEVKLILDEDGHCIDVKKRTSGESEAMIEEFMLLANPVSYTHLVLYGALRPCRQGSAVQGGKTGQEFCLCHAGGRHQRYLYPCLLYTSRCV